jgi:predicted RNA binding protein YcfA (HicA-like mRNA interferase family)
MPRKIRELERELRRDGFEERPAKGSHRKWVHPLVPDPVVLSGDPGEDARPYQERAVRAARQALREAREGGR